jgi:hypothetical protein
MEYEHASDIMVTVIMHMDRRDATVSCDHCFLTTCRQEIALSGNGNCGKHTSSFSFYPAYPRVGVSGSHITYVCDSEPTSTSSDQRPPSAKFRDESRGPDEKFTHQRTSLTSLTVGEVYTLSSI